METMFEYLNQCKILIYVQKSVQTFDNSHRMEELVITNNARWDVAESCLLFTRPELVGLYAEVDFLLVNKSFVAVLDSTILLFLLNCYSL
jgi:hypothetical protein